MNVELPVIEERGTPRELAETMSRLPEGQYRVIVQRVRSREEILTGFDRTTQEMRRNPPPETVDKTDDEVIAWAGDVIRESRRSSRSAK